MSPFLRRVIAIREAEMAADVLRKKPADFTQRCCICAGVLNFSEDDYPRPCMACDPTSSLYRRMRKDWEKTK